MICFNDEEQCDCVSDVHVTLSDGTLARVVVPSGASTGKN